MWLSNAPKIISSSEDLTPKHEMPKATKDFIKEITNEELVEKIKEKYEQDPNFAKGVDAVAHSTENLKAQELRILKLLADFYPKEFGYEAKFESHIDLDTWFKASLKEIKNMIEGRSNSDEFNNIKEMINKFVAKDLPRKVNKVDFLEELIHAKQQFKKQANWLTKWDRDRLKRDVFGDTASIKVDSIESIKDVVIETNDLMIEAAKKMRADLINKEAGIVE